MSTAVAPSTDFAVGFRDMFLEEYTRKEMATTKCVIEAVPEARKEYKPDPKRAAPVNWPGTWPAARFGS